MALYLFLALISLALVSSNRHDDFVRKYENIIYNLSQNATIVRLENQKRQPQHLGATFPCTAIPPSPTVPTSVHALRPGDVKVVGAMGDSLTVGLGADASSIFGVLVENRGMAWSIGGENTYEDMETLPNILKKYNPDLKGYSIGNGDNEDNARFNVAITGGIAADLPDQTRELIDRMKNDPTVDFQNDWKVITIMTGGNDICDVCDNQAEHSAEVYKQHVTTALDMLKAEVPRAFVNLVETVNVEITKELNKGLICTLVHVVCACAAFPDGEEGEQLIVKTTQEYHAATEELVNTGKYDSSDDFTVVVQPFLKETFVPRLPDDEPDLSYFAPDCFHLSRKGHAAAGNALWNNMVERVGQKRVAWSPGEEIVCPTEESPFIFTSKNSISSKLYFTNDKNNSPTAADDTKLEIVNIEIEADDQDQTMSENHTFVIGISILALSLIVLLLSLIFHKKYRGKTIKYRVIDEELLR